MIYKNIRSERASKWNREHPERARKNRDAYKVRHPDRYAEAQKKFHLKKRYNASLQEYNRQFQIQGGKCAICKRHQSEFKFVLAYDHNHQTKEGRGLLCTACNVRVRRIENNEVWKRGTELRSLVIEYLEKYGNQ